MSACYPHVPLTLPVDPTKEEIVALVNDIFTDECVTIEKCSFRRFTDGLTNHLFKFRYTNVKKVEVLLRVYGEKTELLIDREKELATMIELHKVGLAPKVYGTFNNGVCYGFISGTPVSLEEMKDKTLFPLIAQHVAKFHSSPIPSIPQVASFFLTIDKWQKQLNIDHGVRESWKDGMFNHTEFTAELEWMKKEMDNFASWDVCFCHNDLLAGNIVKKNNFGPIEFIDYEYGSYNFALFDVGNHFVEMMGPDVITELFPSEELRKQWLQVYLAALGKENYDFPTIMRQTDLMCLASNLYWGVWSIVQGQYSDVEFDYTNYSKLKISTYLRLKDIYTSK